VASAGARNGNRGGALWGGLSLVARAGVGRGRRGRGPGSSSGEARGDGTEGPGRAKGGQRRRLGLRGRAGRRVRVFLRDHPSPTSQDPTRWSQPNANQGRTLAYGFLTARSGRTRPTACSEMLRGRGVGACADISRRRYGYGLMGSKNQDETCNRRCVWPGGQIVNRARRCRFRPDPFCRSPFRGKPMSILLTGRVAL